jgi:4-amino-4-deoxy-L-arabinose transferase-like glycosyltransferase
MKGRGGLGRFGWAAIVVLAVVTYLYQLDGLYIPRIGDEAPYIEIVRLTAESGQWLPLQASPGLENTKPPLLFWTGIVATDWARHWSLFRLRAPIVIFTFLTAGLVFLLARRMTGSLEGGTLGALSFLGFRSTFQYGRPFLTNLPETFFVFAPVFLLVYFRHRRENRGTRLWLFVGLLLGGAFLTKSFVLAVPVGLTLVWMRLVECRWEPATFLKKDAAWILFALTVALLCFGLWPFLDPEPRAVMSQFVLGQNVAKLGGDNYLKGLFTGSYSGYRIWLGYLASAGLFALPVLHLVFWSVKRRRELSIEEKSLWIMLASFLIVFTVPAQRQENYLLPAVPALAVLLGVHWARMDRRWFYVFLLPIGAALVLLLRLMWAADEQVLAEQGYALWQFAVPAFALALVGVGWVANHLAPRLFHATAISSLLSLSCFLAPFDGPAGRFAPESLSRLKGKTVFVPSGFVSKYERHRFILPGCRVRGYDPENQGELNRLLESRRYVAVHRPLGENLSGPYRAFASRLDLKTRQSLDEILDIIFERDLGLFVQQEIIVRRHTRKRERGRDPGR